MTAVAPPPRPPLEDLEALIEEARRRARRRRFLYAGAIAFALLLAGGIVAVVMLAGGEEGVRAVPPGFHLVKARGPVTHARIQQLGRLMPILIDEQTGKTRRPGLTMDVWWDRKSGLDRVVGSVDGRKLYDVVGQTCLRGAPHICPAPGQLDARTSGYSWPLNPKHQRIIGHGRLRGRDVIWVTTVPVSPVGSDRVALDARTHQLAARIQWFRGRRFATAYYSRLPDAKGFSFVVPDGGVPHGTFPPFGGQVTHAHRVRLGAVRDALGATPLWLGSRFHDKPLRSVEVGTVAMRAQNGSPLRPAKFVSLNYGGLKLQQFDVAHGPFYYLQGPRPGQLALDGSRVTLTHSGLLVFARTPTLFSPESAIALAKALHPLG